MRSRNPGRSDMERHDEPTDLEARLRRAGEAAPPTLDERIERLLAPAKASPIEWTQAAAASASIARGLTTAPETAGLVRSTPQLRVRRRLRRVAAAIVVMAGLAYAVGGALDWFKPTTMRHRVTDADPQNSAVDDNSAVSQSIATVAPVRAPSAPSTDRAPSSVALTDDDDWDPPERQTLHLGVSMNVDARATFEQAPFVARWRNVGERAHRSRDGRSFARPLARVEQVYKGDRALVGKQIELHRCIGQSPRSFLAWSDDLAHFDSFPWVTAFALIDKPALADGTLHAQQLLAEGYGGTLLKQSVNLTGDTLPRDRAE